MMGLTQSLALCTVFIFLTISVLLIIAIFYICKFHYKNIELERCAHEVEPEEMFRTFGRSEKIEHELADELSDMYCTSAGIPQIILKPQDLPPDYSDLESARASPLPSYEDVIYCDQLNRSFQNLLSAS